MDAESFFQRWSRRKAGAVEQEPAAGQTVPPAVAPEKPDRPPPTMADVAALTTDSDFKPFLARGVDEGVRRSALKKLFADPHFNVMDGLDVYIDDYTKFEPIPPEMLAALNHAKSLFRPVEQAEKTVMEMLDMPQEPSAEQPVSEQATAGRNTQEMPAPDEPSKESAQWCDDTHRDTGDDKGDDPDNFPEKPTHDDQV